MPGLAKRATPSEGARPAPRMERRSARAQRAPAGVQHALSDSAMGARGSPGLAHSGSHDQACSARLAAALRTSDLLVGNLPRSGAFSRDMLSRGQLATDWHDGRPRTSRAHLRTDASGEADAGLATPPQVSRAPKRGVDAAHTKARRGESGGTGPDYRSQHAHAAEPIGRPEAENRAARHGGTLVVEAEHGEDQRRCKSTSGW